MLHHPRQTVYGIIRPNHVEIPRDKAANNTRGRAALRAEEQGPEWSPLEPVDDTIERLGAAFDLLMRWLGLAVRVHPEVKEEVEKMATKVMLHLEFRMKQGLDPKSSRRFAEYMKDTLNQAKELAGEVKIQVLSDLHLEHGGQVPEHHPDARVTGER